MRRLHIALISLFLFVGAVSPGSHLIYELWLVDTVWDDLRFPLTRLATGASNPPTFAQFRDDGGSSVGTYAYSFADQGVAGNEEQVWGAAQMPHGWKLATTIDTHAHITLEDATACNVRLCLEYVRGSNGAGWEATTTTICGDCASGTSASAYAFCDIGDISMASHGYLSAGVDFRFYRNSSHANDTCNSKAVFVHEVDFHFEIDTVGSRQELAK